jgi:hypothetical protein
MPSENPPGSAWDYPAQGTNCNLAPACVVALAHPGYRPVEPGRFVDAWWLVVPGTIVSPRAYIRNQKRGEGRALEGGALGGTLVALIAVQHLSD